MEDVSTVGDDGEEILDKISEVFSGGCDGDKYSSHHSKESVLAFNELPTVAAAIAFVCIHVEKDTSSCLMVRVPPAIDV